MFEASDGGVKRRKIDFEVSEDGVMELCVKFNRRDCSNDVSPKSVLLEYTRKQHLRQPSYVVVSPKSSNDRSYI